MKNIYYWNQLLAIIGNYCLSRHPQVYRAKSFVFSRHPQVSRAINYFLLFFAFFPPANASLIFSARSITSA